MNQEVTEINDYLKLKKITDSLSNENASLIQQLINVDTETARLGVDSNHVQYLVSPAKICSKTLNLRNNYFSICAGKRNNIQPNMGVISSYGVVGIIKNVSNNYATVLPLNNSLSRTSCTIKNKNYFGNLVWKSMNPMNMKLEGIPRHARIAVGDSIVTSGYSAIFPKNLSIGTISNFSFSDEGSGNYNIDVKMHYDLSSIENVFVINNTMKAEIDSLRNTLTNE